MNIELRTKGDCVGYFVETRFDNIDSTMVTDLYDWSEHYSFEGEAYDEETDEYAYGPTEPPMWNTWFEPSDSFMRDWIEKHKEEVADLGFTIIYRDEEVWGLGIDGAGYNFRNEHWEPLYDLLGLKWHER